MPISVSAIGGDTLAKSHTTRIDDLTSKVANLQMTGIVGDNTPIFSLRGVSMSDYSLNQSSPVATYYDEVYKGNFAFLGVAMYDLERIEVLRGPQGTLYGKNTTGGAVNIISHSATLGRIAVTSTSAMATTTAWTRTARSTSLWAPTPRYGLPAPIPVPMAGSEMCFPAFPTSIRRGSSPFAAPCDGIRATG
ncbi:Plug domain-containing protein [Sphingomonas sp. I4]